jgi:putative endopeptidase
MLKKIGMVSMIALTTACAGAYGDKKSEPKEVVKAAVAEVMLSSGINQDNMDKMVKPGDDFNAYVSGTWMKNTEIPADKSRFGAFNVLRDNAEADVKAIIEAVSSGDYPMGSDEQKLGDLYQSYMDMETRNKLGTAPIWEDIARVQKITNASDLSEYFAYAGKVGYGAPFVAYVSVDQKSPTEYIIGVWQTGLGLGDREYYFEKDDKSVKIRAEYVAHIQKMLEIAGVKAAAAKAKTVMKLETELAGHHWKKEDNRNSDKTYNKYQAADLKKLMSNIDLKRYFAETGVKDVAAVVVNQPSYIEAVNKMMKSVDIEAWKTYITWDIINSSADRLNQALNDQNFHFYSTVMKGVKEQRPMWRRATATVSGALGEMVGRAYVAKHFKPEAKTRMITLVQNLINSYKNSIKDLEWMSEETKAKALVKLSKFNPKIGYPNKWKDYSTLDIKGDDLFGNGRRASLRGHQKSIAKLGGPIDREEWGMTPQTVNAYFNPTKNEIVFPAAILQAPFFDLDADDAVNYGAIGGVIGHEIGHGFDDSGARYNGDGALENWWTDTDKAEFKKRTNALVAQYDAFKPFDDLAVNGTFTLGENIGDLSGLTIAYKAYKLSLNGKKAAVIDGLTGDQRFFIGWAQAFQSKIRDKALRSQIKGDPHSPGVYRVNGVMRNVPQWYKAFDVKKGDKLYLAPEDRVKIW